jgi:hypothetical protein
MRRAICTIAIGAVALGLFAVNAGSETKSASGFDRLKGLVGAWESTTPEGETFTSTIRLVSNGTAVEETFQSAKDNQMVTIYTPDGNRVVMTHYCAAGNQPHMQTQPTTADQKHFDFAFASITNLADPSAGHMHHMTLEIADNDHFSETWTWQDNGKDGTKTFHFTRKN